MILVDTPVWVDFFRGAERAAPLAELLETNRARVHPCVIGELALGHLGHHRNRILEDLWELPIAETVSDEELIDFIEARRLFGRGIGWVDAQLLGSALVSGARLWTLDGSLATMAGSLGLSPTRG